MKVTQQFWELHTSCLLVDQIVPFDIYIWREGKAVLWRGKETKVTQNDLNHLLDTGVSHVVIGIKDLNKYLGYAEPNAQEIVMNQHVPVEYKSFVIRESTNNILKDLFNSPTDIKIAKRLEGIVSPIVELILSSTAIDPLRFLLERNDIAFSYAPHSARTCYYIIALAIATKKFSQEKLNQLGLAALLHDIGEMMVAPEIREKIGKYTEQERREMEKHPIHSVTLIKKADVYSMDEPTLTAIKSHHELGDKSGYPLHEPLFELPLEARLFVVAHTFESYTTEKIHRQARKSYDVIKHMLSNPKKYPVEIVRQFIEVLGKLEPY